MELDLEESKRKTRQLALDSEFRQIEAEKTYELTRLQAEAKNRNDNEISIRESETQIRIAEISNASSTNLSTSHSNISMGESSCKQIRDLPPLRSFERDNIENYLTHFERSCQLNNKPENKYCSYIAPKLPVELVQILTRLSLNQADNYNLFRENVSRKYLLNSDYFRTKFYSLNMEQGDSNAEFIRKLQDCLDRWLKSEQVDLTYEGLYEFFLRNQFFRKTDVAKQIFIREHKVVKLSEITEIADIYDVAHLRDPSKRKVNNFNSFTQNKVSAIVGTSPQNPEKNCSYCHKKGHNIENCYTKNNAQKTDKMTCSHCKKSGHIIDNCYALHGKPTFQKNKSGPQPSSTFKQKSTHQIAAVNVCEPPRNYLVFENSNVNKVKPDEDDTVYSMLEATQDSENLVFSSCTVIYANEKGHDTQILNPYSKAMIEGSDKPQTVLRDSGSFVSIIKQDLVPTRCYTNGKVSLQFADGTITTVPTALIRIKSNFFTGIMEFAILPHPVSPIIIGNMRHVTENFSNRRNENECSSSDKLQKDNNVTHSQQFNNEPMIQNGTGVDLDKLEQNQVIHENKSNKFVTEQTKSTNCSNKSEKHCKIYENKSNSETEQTISENQLYEPEQNYLSFGNTNMNKSMVSTEPVKELTNNVTTSQVNKINLDEGGKQEVSRSSNVIQFLTPGNETNPEITTLIEYNDQSIVPINAVLTRNKARQLSEIKLPNPLLQIPDISPDKFREMQKSDKGLERFWKIAEGKISQDEGMKANFIIKKGLLYRKPVRPRGLGDSSDTQLVIPTELKHIVLRTAHESVLGCHMGTKKTSQRIQANFWFDGIVSYTHRYCQSCDVCQRTIKHGTIAKAPMLISKLSDAPFSRISCDLVGPIIPTSQNGYTYILTIIDLATRYPDAIPLKRITTGKVADALRDFFFRMGIPDVISTDNGSQFCSAEMEEFFGLFNIKHIRSTVYHPQAQGCIENFNASLKKCSLRLCAEKTKQWDTFIGPCLYALRESTHSSTGFSPNECVFGRTLKSSGQLLRQLLTDDQVVPEVKTTYQHVLDLRSKIQDTCELVKNELANSQQKNKIQFDKKSEAQNVHRRLFCTTCETYNAKRITVQMGWSLHCNKSHRSLRL